VLGGYPLLATALPRGLAAPFELFDRGCHSADRPHLSQTGRSPSTSGLTGQSGGGDECCSAAMIKFG
jgi:hypothetical protein